LDRKSEGQGSGEELGSAAAKNPPAYGTRNAGTVRSGTGETLLGTGGAKAEPPERESERGIVLIEKENNRTSFEGRPCSRTSLRKEIRSVSVDETKPPPDRTTDLQSKLHQAAKSDPKRRFHALYDKLSLGYVLRSAWEAVRRNQGAAGIDRQTLSGIETYGVERFLAEIADALREKSYRPRAVRRVFIPKGGDPEQLRPLGIPTVRDRVVQAAAKLVLEPIFEADFEETSFGFRPGRGARDALEAIVENARQGFRWVVDADIERFFDSMDHDRLMEALRERISDGAMLRLIYRWLKAGYLLDGVQYDADRGSPQGGVLSPLLANAYLHALDRAFREPKGFVGRLTRYADDFVIQCGNEAQARKALEWVAERIQRLGLRLHPEKTQVVNDREEGFDFLGFHHRRGIAPRTGKETWGVLRWPSAKACRRFRQRIREIAGPPGRLRSQWKPTVKALELYLTGWCQYFRHGNSTRIFGKLDQYVLERLSRTLARSQPTGEGRRPRTWRHWLYELGRRKVVPRLTEIQRQAFKAYRGQANVRWRAV
jgi:RNA-directed DNA polymerase